jgi:hypothetical protein
MSQHSPLGNAHSITIDSSASTRNHSGSDTLEEVSCISVGSGSGKGSKRRRLNDTIVDNASAYVHSTYTFGSHTNHSEDSSSTIHTDEGSINLNAMGNPELKDSGNQFQSHVLAEFESIDNELKLFLSCISSSRTEIARAQIATKVHEQALEMKKAKLKEEYETAMSKALECVGDYAHAECKALKKEEQILNDVEVVQCQIDIVSKKIAKMETEEL